MSIKNRAPDAPLALMLALTLALLLNACAAISDRIELDPQNGARRGTVAQFYAAGDTDLPECVARLPKKEFATRHFVRVDYKHVRHLFSTVAEVADPAALKIDEPVEVWLDDCAHGKFGRIGRSLWSPSQP